MVIVAIVLVACFGLRVAGAVVGLTGLLAIVATLAILLPRRVIEGHGGQRATWR